MHTHRSDPSEPARRRWRPSPSCSAGCASGGSGDSSRRRRSAAARRVGRIVRLAEPEPAAAGEVTLVTHDSFVVDEQLLADFEARIGPHGHRAGPGRRRRDGQPAAADRRATRWATPCSASTTPSPPGRWTADVLAPYTSPAAAERRRAGVRHRRRPAHRRRLTATSASTSTTPTSPRRACRSRSTFEDLAKPEYRDLLVVESPATSSPGLAFLLGTDRALRRGRLAGLLDVAEGQRRQGDGRLDRRLHRRLLRLVRARAPGRWWSPTRRRRRPRSPTARPTAPTGALLDTCFRQVEYAGVLAGRQEPGRRAAGRRLPALAAVPGVGRRRHVRLPGGPERRAARRPGSSSPRPPRTRPTWTRPTIADNRDAWISAVVGPGGRLRHR